MQLRLNSQGIVGSKGNDKLSVEYITEQIRNIQQITEYRRSKGENPPHIEMDVQKVIPILGSFFSLSGCFLVLTYLSSDFWRTYFFHPGKSNHEHIFQYNQRDCSSF